MKPALFGYLIPASAAEAGALLRQYGDEAKVLAGVGPGPIRPHDAERALAEGDVQRAAELAATASEPDDDFHASADYRRDMVRVLVRRAARKAVQARG